MNAKTPAEAKSINYERPELNGRPKAMTTLARTDRAFFAVQVVREGGENNLHSHTHLDGFWFVLKGKARFYTSDDALLGEYGPLQGVLIPRGYPYWFESCGEDELEILQCECSDVVFGEPNADRVDHEPPKEWMPWAAASAGGAAASAAEGQ